MVYSPRESGFGVWSPCRFGSFVPWMDPKQEREGRHACFAGLELCAVVQHDSELELLSVHCALCHEVSALCAKALHCAASEDLVPFAPCSKDIARMKEVPVAASSLDDTDVFVMDAGEVVYVWQVQ